MVFRDGIIEALKSGLLSDSMSSFPKGCCGDSALLLGTYLTDIGFGDFTYVCGERWSDASSDWISHAWLTQDSLIIDITKTQFHDCPDDITVIEWSEWYDSFEVTQTFPAYINGSDDQLESYYNSIVEIIKNT